MQGKLNLHLRKWRNEKNGFWQIRCELTRKWFTPPRPYRSGFTCPHCCTFMKIGDTLSWYRRDQSFRN